MSNYQNFISDFPGRCGKILGTFGRRARHHGREVTLMLCIASPGIIIPLERLKGPRPLDNGEMSPGHPSGDWERFRKAKTTFDGLLGQPFLGSPVWPATSEGSWAFGELAHVTGYPDSLDELQTPGKLKPKKQVGSVIRHMRNALAHGNIFTRGGPEIDLIVMLSERCKNANKFNFLAVSPPDFEVFLRLWLDFMRKLDLPAQIVSRFAGVAA